MFYRAIFLFNVLVTIVAALLAGYGLFLALVKWQLFHALAYYLLALAVRAAFVDLPEPTPTR
jgi:hypothetical protein